MKFPEFNCLDYTQGLTDCVGCSGNTEQTVICRLLQEASESPHFADYDPKELVAPEAQREHRTHGAHVNPEVPPKGAQGPVPQGGHWPISTCSSLL